MKKYRLPKEFATKWLEALRSGEYKQGHFKLKQNGKYCCLGVACQISGIDMDKYGMYGSITRDVDLNNVVPKEIRSDLFNTVLPTCLASQNDNGHSFTEIADWIEENVELY